MKLVGNCWPTPEQSLLLQAGLGEHEKAQEAWRQYCQFVDIQKIEHASITMLPLVYRNLGYNKNYPIQFQSCKSTYRYTWSLNNLRLFELKTILDTLHGSSIQTCLLKGAALVTGYYQDAGLRVMGDVDILVPKAQAFVAIKLLMSLNWVPEIDVEKLAPDEISLQTHAILFTHPDGWRLDLHWIVFQESNTLTVFENYPYQIIPITLSQNNIKTHILIPEDQLLHTLTHSIKYSPEPLIRWIPDAAFILKHTPHFDWNYFLAQTKKLEILLMIKTALNYLQENRFANIPSEVIQIVNQYIPAQYEINYFHFITQKKNRFTVPFKLLWYRHRHNARSKNFVIALLTLPSFLQHLWKLEHLYQVPQCLMQKVFQHLKRQCLKLD